MGRHLLSFDQGLDEGAVADLPEGQVEVVVPLPLAPARRREGLRAIDALVGHHGCDGVVEGQTRADHGGKRRGQQVGGEGAGGDDGRAGTPGKPGHLTPLDADARVGRETGGDPLAEILAVHRQRPARRDTGLVGAGQDDAAGAAHLLVE